MKKSILLLCLLSVMTTTISFAVPNRPTKEKTEAVSAKALKKLKKQEAKMEKKTTKLEKRLKKLDKKLTKRGIHSSEAVNRVWDEDNFKLGALLALGGLLLTILGVLPILGGIFAFIGGLMMVIGVVLMIWVLIQSY